MPNELTISPAATVNEPTTPADPDDGGALMRSYLGELSPLTDPQRSAFTRQCSAEKADDWGKRTKAINVLHDSERFARVMHGALAAPRGGLGYTKARFRFHLQAVLDLRDHVEEDRAAAQAQSKAAVGTEKAREVALLARETLLERLSAFAEGDDPRAAALAKAFGSTKDEDALLVSLAALLKLAKTWLGSVDADDQALAESLGLDQATLTGMEAARADLATAHSASLGSGAKVWRDGPATNRIEGRVLFEMRYAMRLFEGAHSRDALSPRLIPGPGTRHVLAPSSRKGKPEETEQPATPTDGGASTPTG